MKIKPIKSELKIRENSIEMQTSEITDLRTLDSNYIINQLEENIKLREMPIEKRISKKKFEHME